MFRNVCFTLNNYTAEELAKIQKIEHNYMVIGKEVGASGTPHLQGYIELAKRTRFKSLQKQLIRSHLEKRQGTAQQAADYCKKDDDYYESGTISNPGKRSDLEAIYNMAKDQKTDVEIGEAHPKPYMRYYRAIDRVRLNYARQDKEFKKLEVLVFVGTAGTGKTKRAYEIDPDLYCLTQSEGTVWFDGYQGQKTLLIDDFYGWIKYGLLLRLLDGYKFNLPIKGGFTWKQWERVIITSNKHPSQWYRDGLTEALNRRITKCGILEESVP